MISVLPLVVLALSLPPAGDVADGPRAWTAPPYFSPPQDAQASGRQALSAVASAPLPFVAVTPCRLVDTRGHAPMTGGFLPPATVRSYTLTGTCNIPSDAKAISLNVAVTTTQGGAGFLAVWPEGGPAPNVATLSFSAGQTVANAAIVPLSASGGVSLEFNVSSGGGDVILDTNGYYSPLGVVNSVNGLAGNVTLTAGDNVTITPGVGTLSISAASGTGPQGPPGVQGPPGAQGPPGPPGSAGSFDQQCLISAGDFLQLRDCLLTPAATVAFNSIPGPTPPNVPSLGFQATQTAEFGDAITLAGAARKGVSATVLMSDWALHSTYPTMSSSGFTHPITLNVYSDAAHALAHTPDVGSFTQNFVIPWRPPADPTCPNGGTAWRAGDGNCYNGFAFTITFNLGGAVLPDTFVYGVAYNTNTWGYAPIGAAGPYESLNVGLAGTTGPPPVPGVVTVGTDIDPNAVYWNTKTAANYADGGAGGVGTFRLDTNWAPYIPAVRFTTVN